jgi:hypothetical protein
MSAILFLALQGPWNNISGSLLEYLRFVGLVASRAYGVTTLTDPRVSSHPVSLTYFGPRYLFNNAGLM